MLYEKRESRNARYILNRLRVITATRHASVLAPYARRAIILKHCSVHDITVRFVQRTSLRSNYFRTPGQRLIIEFSRVKLKQTGI